MLQLSLKRVGPEDNSNDTNADSESDLGSQGLKYRPSSTGSTPPVRMKSPPARSIPGPGERHCSRSANDSLRSNC